jgi:hypothetical protein
MSFAGAFCAPHTVHAALSPRRMTERPQDFARSLRRAATSSLADGESTCHFRHRAGRAGGGVSLLPRLPPQPPLPRDSPSIHDHRSLGDHATHQDGDLRRQRTTAHAIRLEASDLRLETPSIARPAPGQGHHDGEDQRVRTTQKSKNVTAAGAKTPAKPEVVGGLHPSRERTQSGAHSTPGTADRCPSAVAVVMSRARERDVLR